VRETLCNSVDAGRPLWILDFCSDFRPEERALIRATSRGSARAEGKVIPSFSVPSSPQRNQASRARRAHEFITWPAFRATEYLIEGNYPACRIVFPLFPRLPLNPLLRSGIRCVWNGGEGNITTVHLRVLNRKRFVHRRILPSSRKGLKRFGKLRMFL